ncbi:NUDIX hydrolase [Shimia sp. R9_1]|uniref:NUDIX hydrolase n=1 Tax=unclassified Shimia TaxID=2630038 RepID=UPI001ADB1C74|nr:MULTISPECIES: NUDIX hydrolase [unclassified Shimia]MBO9395244.1 NUDIX hydrolase [Shimia sp. R9_2]MBO9399357.1 NUDIX hydrolase [Shimia sp. R9_3]MBO9407249.1 NUDIX hydrolase [Shimia sp. R9_1]
MIPRFGTPPRADKRYRMRPGAYAVLLKGEQMLVTYQSAPHDEFQLPGGGIDPGESPTVALYREVFEETGYRIAKPRRLGAFRRFTFMPEYDLWAEKLCTIYVATPTLRIGPPSEPGHTAVWMDIEDAVAQLANDGDRHFTAQFLR